MLVTYLIVWALLVAAGSWLFCLVSPKKDKRIVILSLVLIFAMWPLGVAISIINTIIKYSVALFKVVNKLLTKLSKRGK